MAEKNTKLTGPVVFRRVRGRIVAMRMKEGSDIHQAAQKVQSSSNKGFAAGVAAGAGGVVGASFGANAGVFHKNTRPFAKGMGVSLKHSLKASARIGIEAVRHGFKKGKLGWAAAGAGIFGGLLGSTLARRSSAKREGDALQKKYGKKPNDSAMRRMGFQKIFTINKAK